MIVINAEVQFNTDLNTFYLKLLKPKAWQLKVELPPPTIENITQEFYRLAKVNHNRWIVDCPWCPGAEFVWFTDLLFMCQNCWNMTVGHKWLQVILPNNIDKIHEHLEKRFVPETRNWYSGESHEDLAQENLDHGIV